MEVDNVNNPPHYAKDPSHIECIHLLDALTRGYSGIAALCIGQFKYAYRAGSKKDSSMSDKLKTIEDYNKIIWYLKHLYKRCFTEDLKLLSSFDFNNVAGHAYNFPFKENKNANSIELHTIIEEFTFDKPAEIKEYLANALTRIYDISHCGDILVAIENLNKIVEFYEKD